jgi:release factor glutamine methyltransferase
MTPDFFEVFSKLSFMTESLRLQYTNYICKHWNPETSNLETIVERIKKNEPIEYILNIAEFYEREFYVDSRCLIPRPETQDLIKQTLDYINQYRTKHGETKFTFIDTGTGSGCIILTLASELHVQGHRYIGLDISTDALDVAKINSKKLKIDNVELVHSTFQEFDFAKYENVVVCSNLPYIPDGEALQSSVYDYEPHTALYGGKKGDELNNLLLEIANTTESVKALFMEGNNGAITSHIFTERIS